MGPCGQQSRQLSRPDSIKIKDYPHEDYIRMKRNYYYRMLMHLDYHYFKQKEHYHDH